MKLWTTLLLLTGWAIGQDALSLTSHIALPDVDGRMDHFAVDLKGQRIFVSALENKTVEVIDVKSGQRVHTIPSVPEPQGLYFEPATNRLFVACRMDGTTRIYDGTTFQLITALKFSGDADNIRYDARSERVIVGYGGQKGISLPGHGTLGFLDASGKQTGELAVDAHPESFQLEKNGTRVFVNVPIKQEIEVLDLAKKASLGRWPTTIAGTCYPMALDEAHRRLFTGCRNPARLLVYDTSTGKTVTSAEIVGDTDDLFYDAARSRVYVIGGQGFIDVLQQRDGDHYDRIARYSTSAGTRTGWFVPDWGKLFAAAPHRGDHRAELLVFDAQPLAKGEAGK